MDLELSNQKDAGSGTTQAAPCSSHCSHASPVYDRDSIRIFHSDCEAIIGTPITKGIKIVVTSPPYNLGAEPWPHLGHWKPGDAGAGSKSKWRNGSDACNGIQYAEHADTMPWDDYCRWQRRVLTKLWKFLPDDGAIFYNHKPRVIGGRLWLPLELLPMGVTLRQIIIWARPGGMNFNPTAFVPAIVKARSLQYLLIDRTRDDGFRG